MVSASFLSCIVTSYGAGTIFTNRNLDLSTSFSPSVLTLLFLGISTGFGGLALYLIEKIVFSRLTELNRLVSRAGLPSHLSGNLSGSGEDELAALAGNVSDLLRALDAAQAQNQEQEERYRLLTERCTDLITRHNLEGVILYASPACYPLLGYQPEELIGQDPSMFLHARELKSLAKAHQLILTQDMTYPLTYRVHHRDGHYLWFETTSNAIRDPETGVVQEILAVSRDISDHKRREQQLQESEASIRALYQVTSSQSLNFQGRLQNILRVGCHKFGLEAGVFSQIKNLEDVPSPTVYQCHIIAALTPKDTFKPGQVYDLNNSLCIATAKAKHPLYFESLSVTSFSEVSSEVATAESLPIESYMGIPVTVAGKVYGTLCFWSAQPQSEPFKAVDRELLKLMAQWIGGELERQQTSQDLAQARDEALAATHAKSEFLATMSHEIRTPMNAVIGMAGLLLDTPLTSTQQDFVETIRSSSDALLSLIDDILDSAKIESGHLELEHNSFEIRTCIEESIDFLATKAASKNLELVYLLDPATPSHVIGDMTRLRQILVNLLSNAVKFTDQGEIMITVKASPLDRGITVESLTPELTEPLSSKVQPAKSPSRYEIQFTVQDTGIGIPPERMNRLFHSFSQVDSSTSRQYGGTGLGLAISKRLVEMMGGYLWVESRATIAGDPPPSWQPLPRKPDSPQTVQSLPDFNSSGVRGSTFYFTIVVESCHHFEKPENNVPLKGKHLLIVDENAMHRQILTLQAESWGMQATAVKTAREALQHLQQEISFDLVLLEMHLSDMEGLALARSIHHLPHRQTLPLVMLTSMGQSSVSESNSRDIRAFLTKPIKQSQLYNLFINLLGEEPLEVRLNCQTHLHSSSKIPILAKALPLRILLAEDHLVNQKVALQILHRMGYQADVADNGLEVLAALEQQPYDVVLMDMQMPEMDGIETAQQIHRCYQQRQAVYYPRPRIIAVTANAMESDRHACLAAGMDDYISKPIRMEQLVAALKKCIPANIQANRDTSPGIGLQRSDSSILVATPHESCLQASSLNSQVLQALQEIDALEEAITAYLESAPQLLKQIETAITATDVTLLRDGTHSLKSISGTLGATTLFTYCQKLEVIARIADTPDALVREEVDVLYNQIAIEFAQVRLALQQQLRLSVVAD
ncbi:MAG: response regulator [Microcoleaceae cyanobacterium]